MPERNPGTGRWRKPALAIAIAALAALVGLFTEQAALKLKSVAETLMTRPDPGEDSQPQGRREADATG